MLLDCNQTKKLQQPQRHCFYFTPASHVLFVGLQKKVEDEQKIFRLKHIYIYIYIPGGLRLSMGLFSVLSKASAYEMMATVYGRLP